jgi:hypothetical protein
MEGYRKGIARSLITSPYNQENFIVKASKPAKAPSKKAPDKHVNYKIADLGKTKSN